MNNLTYKFRQVKKLPNWIIRFLAGIHKLVFRLFYRTEVIDLYHCEDHEERVVALTWHNRLLFLPSVFPKYLRSNTQAVVSASRDGQYVADFVACYGLSSLRGSSSKRGLSAQLDAVQSIRENHIVFFTPDGPRGPRYHIKPGPAHLASVTGALVVPVCVNASRYWEIKSWDKFQIPKPFAKLTLVIGRPLAVPPDLNAEELEKYRQRIEKAMLDVTRDRGDKREIR